MNPSVLLPSVPTSLVLLTHLAGCGPKVMRTGATEWPAEIQGRTLYDGGRAVIYATDAAAARFVDDYLSDRLPAIEARFGLRFGRGVVFAIAPGDPPMTGIGPWPQRPAQSTVVYQPAPTSFDLDRLGIELPVNAAHPWICALVTDAFFREQIRTYHGAVLHRAEMPSLLTSWPFLFLLPAQAERWMAAWDVRREMAMALALLDSTQPDRDQLRLLRESIESFYADKLRQPENSPLRE